MIIIDHKTDTVYQNITKAEASRLVGVCWQTINNWSKKREVEDYHHFTIYFNPVKYKQPQRNTSNNRLLD